MELNLQRRVAGLKDKLPDIQKTLDTVQFLKLRKVRTTCVPDRGEEGHEERRRQLTRRTCAQDETDAIETTFELNDTLHARAEVPPTDEVFLWLGVRQGFPVLTSVREILATGHMGRRC